MLSIRKFVTYSTFLGMFSSNFFFTVGTAHYLYFYLLVFVNLTLLWLMHSLWFPRGLFVFLSYLLLSGLVGLALRTDSVAGFSKAYLGILFMAVYSCAFLRFMDFDIVRCFEMYAQLAYYVALLGIVYFPFQPYPITGRLISVEGEPGEFCLLCIPAVFYYADQWQREGVHGWRITVLLVAFLLTFSSTGYIGLLLVLYLFGRRYRLGKVVAPVTVLVAGMAIYSASNYFRMRFDDSVRSLLAADLTGINNSSFGVISNVFVTKQVITAHPFLGGGLGSHVVAHDSFTSQLVGTESFIEAGVGDLGRWDAQSLLLRITSETGLFGLSYASWFLWFCWPRGETVEKKVIATSVLTYVFLKLLRSGIYFNPEEFFLLVLYALVGWEWRHKRRMQRRLASGEDEVVPSFERTIERGVMSKAVAESLR